MPRRPRARPPASNAKKRKSKRRATRRLNQRKHPLQNRAEANEHNEQLEKLRQSAVISEFIDSPKADCSDDHDDQHADQN
jgi:hypothetical protein